MRELGRRLGDDFVLRAGVVPDPSVQIDAHVLSIHIVHLPGCEMHVRRLYDEGQAGIEGALILPPTDVGATFEDLFDSDVDPATSAPWRFSMHVLRVRGSGLEALRYASYERRDALAPTVPAGTARA